MNLGFGLGGLAGGLIASAENTGSFTILFGLDAATFLAFALILTRLPAVRRSHDEPRGMPVFVKNQAGVSERGIGVFFLVHTAAVVLAQLPITRWSEGRRRMPALALMGALWAASWIVVLVAGAWLHGSAALGALVGVALLFALGACLHGTVQGPLVVDLAERHTLGRYMAVSSLSWQVAFIVGPAAGGAILDAEPLALWPAAAAVCLAGSGLALVLERGLPRPALHTPARPPLVPQPVGVEAAPAPGMVTRPSG